MFVTNKSTELIILQDTIIVNKQHNITTVNYKEVLICSQF